MGRTPSRYPRLALYFPLCGRGNVSAVANYRHPLREQSLWWTEVCFQKSPKAGGTKRTRGNFCHGCAMWAWLTSHKQSLQLPTQRPWSPLWTKFARDFLGQMKDIRAKTCPFCAHGCEIIPLSSCVLQFLPDLFQHKEPSLAAAHNHPAPGQHSAACRLYCSTF